MLKYTLKLELKPKLKTKLKPKQKPKRKLKRKPKQKPKRNPKRKPKGKAELKPKLKTKPIQIRSVQAMPTLPVVVPAAALAVLASVSVLCHRSCQIANTEVLSVLTLNSQRLACEISA